MGCWNQTCMLSHLPINSGDPVVGYIVVSRGQADLGGGCCYPTDIYAPLFVPIYGEYDDYGRIDGIDASRSAGLLEWVIDGLTNPKGMPLTLKPDRCAKDKENVPLPTSLKELIDVMQESRLHSTWDKKKPLELGYVMMHQSVHDALIASYYKRKPYKKEEQYGDLLKSYISGLLGDLNTTLTPPPESASQEEKDQYYDLVFLKQDIRRGKLFYMEDSNLNSSLIDVVAKHMPVEQQIETLVSWRMICNVVYGLRLMWIPQAGQGSQSREYALHLELMNAINCIVDAECKDHDVDYANAPEDYDPWNGEETIFWYER